MLLLQPRLFVCNDSAGCRKCGVCTRVHYSIADLRYYGCCTERTSRGCSPRSAAVRTSWSFCQLIKSPSTLFFESLKSQPCLSPRTWSTLVLNMMSTQARNRLSSECASQYVAVVLAGRCPTSSTRAFLHMAQFGLLFESVPSIAAKSTVITSIDDTHVGISPLSDQSITCQEEVEP